jgi:phosphate transport system protein
MEASDLTHHTSRRYNEELERVRSKVLAMGGFVEEQLVRSLTALAEGDSELGRAVALSDYQVNGMEVAIDEECSRILATRSPAAGDLRKIGQIAARLATVERPTNRYREVKHLGRIVQALVHDALDAFARLDAGAALATCRRDRIVDEEYESIQRQCITFMMEDARMIRQALDVMWVVRSLERIGDHAKNICEYVIYMVHGKDVRHTSLDHIERELALSPGPTR